MEWRHLRSVALMDSARPSALALFCADTEPGEGRLEASVKALVGELAMGWKVALANAVVAKTL